MFDAVGLAGKPSENVRPVRPSADRAAPCGRRYWKAELLEVRRKRPELERPG
jgi:hypothetical protein